MTFLKIQVVQRNWFRMITYRLPQTIIFIVLKYQSSTKSHGKLEILDLTDFIVSNIKVLLNHMEYLDKRILMHQCLFKNSAQWEPWFQYVRKVYTTAINFPCLTFLVKLNYFMIILHSKSSDFKLLRIYLHLYYGN